jgi:hypothetical protein
MDQWIAWVVAAFALYGTWLNAKKDIRGFYFWIASNTAFCFLNLRSGQMAQAFLFAVYVVLAFKGLEDWNDGGN